MPTTVAYRTIGIEFHPFLYALIGDDKNGVPLSMLSALARQDIDPWEQAAEWSRLPRNAAARELTTLLSALPEGPCTRPAPDAIAARLIALLPAENEFAGDANAPGDATTALPQLLVSKNKRWIFIYALFLLLGQWIFADFEESTQAEKTQTQYSGSASTPSSAPRPEH